MRNSYSNLCYEVGCLIGDLHYDHFITLTQKVDLLKTLQRVTRAIIKYGTELPNELVYQFVKNEFSVFQLDQYPRFQLELAFSIWKFSNTHSV